MGMLEDALASTPAKFLFGGSAYHQNLQAEENAARVGGLLESYRFQNPPQGTLGDDGLSIPPQSGFVGQGGLPSGGPPPSFYMQAGLIPGYGDLLRQAQVGQQAMERQMQFQDFSKNNLTMAENINATLNQAKFDRQKEREDMEWNPKAGMTNYQFQSLEDQRRQTQGQLGVSYGNLGLNRQKFEIDYPVNPNTGLREPRPAQAPALAPDKQLAVLNQVGTLANSINTLQDIKDYIKDNGGFSIESTNPQAAAAQQAYVSAIRPLIRSKYIQPGEASSPQQEKAIEAEIGSMTGPGFDATKQKKLDMLIDEVKRLHQPYSAVYGLPQLTAQRGQSSFAKSYPRKSDIVRPDPARFDPFDPKAPMGGR